ncbi:MAG: hypothetical protein HY674_19045 [Chloroflexi bacterium]|nr:hypothetical protein [Chloroflexota bacterium]
MKTRTHDLIHIALALLCPLAFAPSVKAQVSKAEIFDYVRTVWKVTDKTDAALEELINNSPADVSYGGIPFKDLISFLLKVPEIYSALGNDDYRTAAKLASEFAAEKVFSEALKQAGLSSISAPVFAAFYPIDAALQSFLRAVKTATFDYQCRLYVAARKAGNSHDSILGLRGGDLIDAVGSVAPQGLLTKDDDDWLYATGRYTGNNPGVFGYTPNQLYEHARLLYETQQTRLQQGDVERALGNAFRALAYPSAPTIVQQPRDGNYSEGGSLRLSVVASGVAPLRYQWFRNGQTVPGAIQSAYTAAEGDAGDFEVEIIDGNGLKVWSKTVTVSVTPAGAAVALTAPSTGAEVAGTTTVRASSTAATKVGFYVDGLLRFTDTLTPFSWAWNTTLDDNGSHTLTAKAFNSSTLLGTSAARTVTINNATVPTCNDAGEPNNSSLSATPLAFGTQTSGFICTSSDVDWFKISISTPSILQISLTVPAGLDYDLELYGPDARWIAGSYQEAGTNEVIEQLAVTPGSYYFRVYGHPVGRGSSSGTAPYQIVATRTDAAADTITSGEINQPATWAGVVELVGDVTIGPGGSLRILPGTQIRSLAGVDQRASGVDPNKIENYIPHDINRLSGDLRASASAGRFDFAAVQAGFRIRGGHGMLQQAMGAMPLGRVGRDRVPAFRAIGWICHSAQFFTSARTNLSAAKGYRAGEGGPIMVSPSWMMA